MATVRRDPECGTMRWGPQADRTAAQEPSSADSTSLSGVQWVYKATTTKVDYVPTLILADKRGFLCRSAYSDGGGWVSNVRGVDIGDVIHFYYVRLGKKPAELGMFEVVAASSHQQPEFFGERVEGTALWTVKDPALVEYLAGLGGYLPDPTLGRFTGWPIRKVGPAAKYDPAMFAARATLQRYLAPLTR